VPTGLSTYGESRGAGLSMPRSLTHAVVDAAIEKYTEYFPGSKLLESGGKPLFREMGKYLGRELTGEEIAQVTQDLNAMMGARPDMTLKDIAEGMVLTAGATLVGGAVQGGIMRGGMSAVSLLAGQPAEAAGATPVAPGTPPAAPMAPPSETGAADLLAPVGATVEPMTPEAPAGAVSPETVDISGGQNSLESLPPNNLQPVYLVKPTGATLPEQVIATTSEAEAKAQLEAISGAGEILRAEAPADAIQAARNAATAVPEIAQQLTSAEQAILPASLFEAPVGPQIKPAPEMPAPLAPVTVAPTSPPKSATPTINMRFGKGKNRKVEFVSAADKVAYQAASTLKKMGRGKVSDPMRSQAVSWINAAAKEVMGRFGETDVAVAMKVIYAWHQGVIERVKADITEGPISIPALTQAEYDLLKGNLAGAPKEVPSAEVGGYVSYGGEVVETPHLRIMKMLVEKWQKLFAPNAKIIITGQATKLGVGASVGLSDTVYTLTVPNESLSRFGQISTLAHEFGHIIFHHYFHNPAHADAMERIRQDFEGLKIRSKSMTVEEFIRAYHSPEHIRVALKAKTPEELAAPASVHIDERDQNFARRYAEHYGQEAYVEHVRTFGLSYTWNLHEFAAEQMARYVSKEGKRLIPKELHGIYSSIVASLKDFYTKVVAKLQIAPGFEAWVNSLNGLDSIRVQQELTTTDEKNLPVQLQLIEWESIGKQVDYTTKVLSRLPKLPRLKKETIQGEMRRADVRENERSLIEDVLASLPGETVDAEIFKQEVLSKLIPLTPQEIDRYASYGVANVDQTFSQFHMQDTKSTIIWEWPYETPAQINGHFGSFSDKYFAHTRVWENANQGGAFYIVEVQSDWKVSKEERADYLEAAQADEGQMGLRTQADEETFNRSRSLIPGAPLVTYSSWVQFLSDEQDYAPWMNDTAREVLQDQGPGAFLSWLHVNLPMGGLASQAARTRELIEILEEASHYIQSVPYSNLHLAEAGRGLQFYDSLRKSLPKNWWELVIRAQLKQLAEVKAGAFPAPSIARFPTGMTAARMEGWLEAIHPPAGMLVSPTLRVQPKYQGLFDFYDKTLRQFLQREFGGQEVMAVDGASWIEVPLKDLKGLSVEYFSMNESIGETVDKLAEVNGTPEFGKTANRFKGFILNALQINQLVKVFGGRVEGLTRFRNIMRDMTAMKNRLMMGPNERLTQWYSLGRDKARAVESLLKDEVNLGVHYTYLRKTTDAQGREIWLHEPSPELVAQVKKRGLNEKQVQLYLGIKNDFTTALGVMEMVLKKSVAKYFKNNPILAAIRYIEIESEFQRFREKPYLPDRGFGRFSVMIHAGRDVTLPDGREIKKGELVYWRKFENERAQRKHLAEMKAKHQGGPDALNVSASIVEDIPFVMRGIPRNFVSVLAQELSLDPNQIEKLQQLQYDATKEGAFLKLLEKGKKGVGGASGDIRRVYADYFWRSANLVAKMNYSTELNAAVAAVHAQAVELRNRGGISNFLDALHQRLVEKTSYVLNPTNEWEQLRMIFSLWYLYAVPKSAVMNMTSLATTGWSHLAAEFGDAKATAAILKAMKDISLTFRDASGKSLGPDEHLAMSRALEDGSTDQSFAAELAAVSDGNAIERMIPHFEWFADSQVADSVRQASWKSIYYGMLPFRAVEQFNRRVILLAAYRLAKDKGKKSLSAASSEAYDFARNAVDYTQNDYSAWNKPKFLEGKKSMFLIFFSFVQHMTFFMYGGDKGWWRGLMILMAMGGIFAIPFAENLIDMFNWAWTKLSGERTDLRVEARKVAKELTGKPDLVLHGGFHSIPFLGWDVSGSVGLGRVIPGTDAIFGNGKFDERFVQAVSEAGGPAAGVLMNGMRAIVDDRNPSALARFDRMMPTVVKNIYRASEMAKRGAITNAGGEVLAPNATGAEIVGQAMGFQPARKTEAQEKKRAVNDAIQWYQIRRANLLSRLDLARKSGDKDLERKARNDIDAFNKKAGGFMLEINGKDIVESWKAHLRQDTLKGMDLPMQKRYMDVYRDVGGAFAPVPEEPPSE